MLGDTVFLNNGREGLQMSLDGNRINVINDELDEFTDKDSNGDTWSIISWRIP